MSKSADPTSARRSKKPKSAPKVVKFEGHIDKLDDGDILSSFSYQRYDRGFRTLVVPLHVFRKDALFRAELERGGCNLEPDTLQALKQHQRIDPAVTKQVHSKAGWRDDIQKFAFPGRELMIDGRPHSFFVNPGDILYEAFTKRSGSLKRWKAKVCKAVANSNYAIFALGVGFAGPLLRFSKATEGAVFAFIGTTTVGKTDSTMPIVAIMGYADRHQLWTWDTTPTGLKDRLEAIVDFTLFIDDVSRVAPGPDEQIKAIHDIAHAISGGGKRMRAKSHEAKHGEAQTRRPALAMTSAELTEAELAAGLRGGKVKGGVAVRFIAIPVPKQADGGVFDIAVQGAAPEDIIDLARRAALELEGAVDGTYGVAFIPYLEFLERNYVRLPAMVQAVERRFVDEVKAIAPHAASPTDLRIATKFGLVLAGLELAIAAGVVPFTVEQARAAVHVCFDAAVGHLRRTADRLGAHRRALRKVLRDRRSFPVLARGQAVHADAPAFCRMVKGKPHVYVQPENLPALIRAVSAEELPGLMTLLAQRGDLLLDAEGEKTRPVKIGGAPVRHYVFGPKFVSPRRRKQKGRQV